MDLRDWLAFLQEFNGELLISRPLREALDNAKDDDLAQAVQAGWLGYPGATEDQLLRAGERLGTTLPPGYRAFLRISNGWRLPGHFVPRVRSAEELEWFRTTDSGRELIEVYREIDAEEQLRSTEELERFRNVHAGRELIENYRGIDNEEWDTAERMERALVVSDFGGDDECFLIIPNPANPGAEWEAWCVAHWAPGYWTYVFFAEMMIQMREIFIQSERYQDHLEEVGLEQVQREESEASIRRELGTFLTHIELHAQALEHRLQQRREPEQTTYVRDGIVYETYLGLAQEIPADDPQRFLYEPTEEDLLTFREVLERARRLEGESRSLEELLSALRAFKQDLEQQAGTSKYCADELEQIMQYVWNLDADWPGS